MTNTEAADPAGRKDRHPPTAIQRYAERGRAAAAETRKTDFEVARGLDEKVPVRGEHAVDRHPERDDRRADAGNEHRARDAGARCKHRHIGRGDDKREEPGEIEEHDLRRKVDRFSEELRVGHGVHRGRRCSFGEGGFSQC